MSATTLLLIIYGGLITFGIGLYAMLTIFNNIVRE
jgi:hypothetical protein